MHAKPHRSSISSISTRVHTCPSVHVPTRVRAQDVDAQDAVRHDPGLDHGRRGGAATFVRMEQVGSYNLS